MCCRLQLSGACLIWARTDYCWTGDGLATRFTMQLVKLHVEYEKADRHVYTVALWLSADEAAAAVHVCSNCGRVRNHIAMYIAFSRHYYHGEQLMLVTVHIEQLVE